MGTLALHLTLTALMLGVWALSSRTPHDSGRWILGAGLAARALLFFVPAFTTHDVRRYLWDGRVALAGLDPYRVAADSALAAALQPAWAVAPEHAAYVTLYPPGAIALFAACAAFGPTLAFWAWKAVVTAAALGALGLAVRMLEERCASRHLALVALSPLLVLESGIGAHLDALSTFAVVAGLLFAGRRRPIATGAVLGLGGLIKFLPLVLLLPLAAKETRIFSVKMISTAVAVMAVGYGGALAMGLQPVGSLAEFFLRWRFGSPGFSVLKSVVGSEHAVALSLLVALAAVVGLSLVRSAHASDVLGASLLTSPILFPWYLTPLVPAIAIAPSAVWLVWTLAAPLTYEVLDVFDTRGDWSPRAWPLWAIGIGAVLGLAVDCGRWITARSNSNNGSPESKGRPSVPPHNPDREDEGR